MECWQEKEAKQQAAILNQRLLEKEQQVAQLADVIDATRADGHHQIKEMRSLAFDYIIIIHIDIIMIGI